MKKKTIVPEILGKIRTFRMPKMQRHILLLIFIVMPIILSVLDTLQYLLIHTYKIDLYSIIYFYESLIPHYGFIIDLAPLSFSAGTTGMSLWIEAPDHSGQNAFYVNVGILDVLLIPMFIYAIKPKIYSMKNYFDKKGYQNVVYEYKFLKLFVCICAPIVIIFNFLYYVEYYEIGGRQLSFEYNTGAVTLTEIAMLELTVNFLHYLMFPVIAGIIWIVILHIRKEFKFYMAKTYFQLTAYQKDKTSKVGHLIHGIKSYDSYLRRSLNLQINNIKEVFSKIIVDSNIDNNNVTSILLASFQNDSYKLAPARCLSEITNIQDPKQFLIEESISERIKDNAIFFATVIPVLITVTQLLIPRG